MDQELKKIELPSDMPSSMKQEIPSTITKRKKALKTVGVVLLSILGVCVIGAVILGIMLLPLQGVIAKGKEAVAVGRELGTAIKDQDLEQVKLKLADTRKKLTELSDEYKKIGGLKVVPFLGVYIADGDHAIKAGFAGLDAGDRAIEALEPNADLLGLSGKSTFVSGTADERLQTAVKTMNVLIPKINEISVSVDTIRKELEYIDPNRYPKQIGKTVIREKMVSGLAVIEEAANLFVNAQPLLVNLPKLLGEPTEKRYLVLFQNDKELRSTGGFLTAYAQFRMSRGKPILEKSDDIYDLDAAKKKNFPAPPEILKFHKGVYNLNIRDANLSPDFKISMQKFEELYETVSGKEKIDGIWAVDTHVLVEALKILGPMTIGGREYSAEIDKRCDCPRAIYELEDYSTRPVGYVRTERKDNIGILLHQLMQKALGVSPSQYWGKLFQMLISEINQKHVLAYFHDEPAQKAAESFNLAGRIMSASDTAALLKYDEGNGWDYVHINNSNMAGAKSNLFVKEEITKDTTVNADGTLTTTLTVEYKNPFPGSDCGLESGGLCLNAPLRNWVRVYVPAGSTLKESKGTQSPSDGKPIAMDTYDSLGKTVFEGFLIVNPLGTAQLQLTYTSPVKPDGPYKLLYQKQPGTDGQQVILRLNGKDRKKFTLDTDIEIVL